MLSSPAKSGEEKLILYGEWRGKFCGSESNFLWCGLLRPTVPVVHYISYSNAVVKFGEELTNVDDESDEEEE